MKIDYDKIFKDDDLTSFSQRNLLLYTEVCINATNPVELVDFQDCHLESSLVLQGLYDEGLHDLNHWFVDFW